MNSQIFSSIFLHKLFFLRFCLWNVLQHFFRLKRHVHIGYTPVLFTILLIAAQPVCFCWIKLYGNEKLCRISATLCFPFIRSINLSSSHAIMFFSLFHGSYTVKGHYGYWSETPFSTIFWYIPSIICTFMRLKGN